MSQNENPNSNWEHSVKRLNLKRTHHCPICKGMLTAHCLKKGHIVFCEIHTDDVHRPNWECVKCSEQRKREEREEAAAREAERNKADEDDDDMGKGKGKGKGKAKKK